MPACLRAEHGRHRVRLLDEEVVRSTAHHRPVTRVKLVRTQVLCASQGDARPPQARDPCANRSWVASERVQRRKPVRDDRRRERSPVDDKRAEEGDNDGESRERGEEGCEQEREKTEYEEEASQTRGRAAVGHSVRELRAMRSCRVGDRIKGTHHACERWSNERVRKDAEVTVHASGGGKGQSGDYIRGASRNPQL
jgi:hypothetical protein